MARHAEGWRLKWRHPDGPYHVRFTWKGTRYDVSTGERSEEGATPEAAKIYAAIISGRRTEKAVVRSSQSLLDLFSAWFAAAKVGPRTLREYKIVSSAHLLPFFKPNSGLEAVTTESGNDYSRVRLKKVTRRTLKHELSVLRGFLDWCVDEKLLAHAPPIQSPPDKPKFQGTRRITHVRVDLTVDQIETILKNLPERGQYKCRPRAFFGVLWETGLRPVTVQRLTAPRHYKTGNQTLYITADIDKSRYERRVPLTEKAREYLDSVCPEAGLLFPPKTWTKVLRNAARAAGLPKELVEKISSYDFRHARITERLEATGNLPGVAHLVGHKQTTTTNRYTHASERAARNALGL